MSVGVHGRQKRALALSSLKYLNKNLQSDLTRYKISRSKKAIRLKMEMSEL